MKALRAVALLLTIIVSAFTLALMCPQITDQFPKVKSFVEQVRSTVSPAPARKSSGPIVVTDISPGANLTPAQAQFLEQHRRRHQLLRTALVQ